MKTINYYEYDDIANGIEKFYSIIAKNYIREVIQETIIINNNGESCIEIDIDCESIMFTLASNYNTNKSYIWEYPREKMNDAINAKFIDCSNNSTYSFQEIMILCEDHYKNYWFKR
jgi:hypothetical protein